MILVVGSTGMVGSDICRRLVKRGEPVRALVRSTSDPAKVAALRDLGVEIVVGDVRRPGSLDAACRGAHAVVCTVSSMPFSYVPDVNDIQTTDMWGVLDLVAAASRADMGRFVYLSFSGNLDTPSPLREAKRAVEENLRHGKLEYTILRPTCFMEVWLGPAVGFDPANAKVTIYGDGTRPVSWIAAGDVAEFATRALLTPEARNATFELGGPQAITPLEAVRIFERVGGRPFEVQYVPEEALHAQLASATDPMQESFAALMCSVAQGDRIEMEHTLSVLPVPLTSVEEYAERVYGRVPVGTAG